MDSDAHDYDITVPDDEIRRRLVANAKPWWDPVVLRYLHHEMNMSLPQIGDVFGITRQSVHEAAEEIGVDTERKHGSSKVVDGDQTLLGDFERSGLEDFL